MIRYVVLSVFILTFVALSSHGNDRPSPADFSDEIGQYWANMQFDDLRDRADHVYANHPNFVPALVASSFIDGIFRGDLQNSRKKAQKVKDFTEENLEAVDERFVIGIDMLLDMIDQEIAFHDEAGRTPTELENSASPAAVREAFGPVLIPYLHALAFAPDVEIPPEP